MGEGRGGEKEGGGGKGEGGVREGRQRGEGGEEERVLWHIYVVFASDACSQKRFEEIQSKHWHPITCLVCGQEALLKVCCVL